MNRKIPLVQYGISLLIIALPLAFVIGNLLAITHTGLAQIFPSPSSVCANINCLFLLAPQTVRQLLLIATYGVLSLVYLFVFTHYFHNTANKSNKEQLMIVGLAIYFAYIQILRIMLSFAIFQYSLRWWIPLISRIAIFSLTLHAGMFFAHSFLLIMKRKISAYIWIAYVSSVSFCITYLIPLDPHLLTEHLIHKTGYFGQLQFFITIVYGITLINYIKHYTETQKKEGAWLQIGYAFNAFAMYTLFITNKSNTLVIVALVAFTLSIIGLSKYTALKSRTNE